MFTTDSCLAPMRLAAIAAVTLGLTLGPVRAEAGEVMTKSGPMVIQMAVMGLDMPWAFDFLPVEGLLVAEKSGKLLRVDSHGAVSLGNVPEVADLGQGGLLDVLVPRDYETSHEIFLSYSVQQGDGEGTALARAVLKDNAASLEQVEEIFEMAPGTEGRQHFGSRLAEGPDGTIYMTIGDRGDSALAQDLSQHAGKIIRVNRDGSVPEDNPFVDMPGAQPEIWCYGHRNPLGAAFDPQGRFWITEQGPRGGDEVNLVEPGHNYGWPLVTYGVAVSPDKARVIKTLPGIEQPVLHWDPSVMPSGIAFYTGDLVKSWQGDAFVGSLTMDYIAHLDKETMAVTETIQSQETKRVRDVALGPDGALWFLSETNGALYRIVPDTW